jgi:hypothetical protein
LLAESSLCDEVLQDPVTAEAVMSLHGLIQQNAYTDDETNKLRLLTCLQKVSNAAQVFIAECALLKDDNRLLFCSNNEAKVRRSFKSENIGRAKVMKYENIKKERMRRATKKADVATKKGGRKRKASAMSKAQPKKVRRSEIEVAEDEIVAEGLGEYCSVFQATAVVSNALKAEMKNCLSY